MKEKMKEMDSLLGEALKNMILSEEKRVFLNAL